MTMRQAKAVAKIGIGGARIASGVATCLGKGMVATYLNNHHLRQLNIPFGRNSIVGGKKMIDEGIRELRRS